MLAMLLFLSLVSLSLSDETCSDTSPLLEEAVELLSELAEQPAAEAQQVIELEQRRKMHAKAERVQEILDQVDLLQEPPEVVERVLLLFQRIMEGITSKGLRAAESCK